MIDQLSILSSLSYAICLLLLLNATGGAAKGMSSSVPPSDPRIVGVWNLVGGDYPLTNEYRTDGTVVQRVGVRVGKPSPFRIEGDLLIVSVKQPDGRVSEQKKRFELKDDTLTFLDDDGSKRIFRRDKHQ